MRLFTASKSGTWNEVSSARARTARASSISTTVAAKVEARPLSSISKPPANGRSSTSLRRDLNAACGRVEPRARVEFARLDEIVVAHQARTIGHSTEFVVGVDDHCTVA
jgi:hypothetical protein